MMNIYIWEPMESAPKETVGPYATHREFLAVRDGKVIICWWNDDKYAKIPRPFWDGTDRFRGVRWMRETPPIKWTLLPDPYA